MEKEREADRRIVGRSDNQRKERGKQVATTHQKGKKETVYS